MQFLSSLVLAAALSPACWAGAGPGYLQLGLDRRRADHPHPYLIRRQSPDGTVDAVLLQNTNQLEYLVNITVGTPPQSLAVTVDTGSSDLWVPAASSELCKKKKCDEGNFAPKSSSSYTVVEQGGFNITYAAPGDSDAGDWATDTVTVGGSPDLHSQQIGVAYDLYDPHGVLGVGFDTNEATNDSPNQVYPSVLDNMRKSGVINRKAFSLYLNDLQATQGAIVFGGVDATKYTGDLVVLPLQAGPQGLVSEYYVTLTGVSFTDETGATTQLSPANYAQAVLLDSGTSATLLTNDVFAELANGFGAVDIGQGSYVVPCRFSGINGTINYAFGGDGGVTVSVPVSQVIGGQDFTPDNFADESGGCDFGFGPPIGGASILGDTFLRNAYVVFDQDNKVAAVAQAALNETTTSSIVALPSGTNIPGATITAAASGTQIPADEATASADVPSASFKGTSLVLAGTPTFNIGVFSTAPTGAGSAATSTGAAAVFAAQPTLALLGLGLAAGFVAV